MVPFSPNEKRIFSVAIHVINGTNKVNNIVCSFHRFIFVYLHSPKETERGIYGPNPLYIPAPDDVVTRISLPIKGLEEERFFTILYKLEIDGQKALKPSGQFRESPV